MKKLINTIVYCTLFFSISLSAQWSKDSIIKGNGKVITEKRNTASYDEIKVGGAFDVELVSGKEGEITIKGEENLVALIKIEVEGNTLKIYPDKNKNIGSSSGKNIVITVPIESISDVSLGGSGSIIGKTTLKSEQFTAKLSGSGDIFLTIDATNAVAALSGSGDISIKGKATIYESKLSGSGDINSYELESENGNAAISGSGNIRLFCSNNLTARISGSGNVDYKGNPKVKDTKVSGSGRISKK